MGMELSLVRWSKNNAEKTQRAYSYVRVDLYTQTYGQVSRHPLWKVSVYYIKPMSWLRDKWKVKTRLGAMKTHMYAQTHTSVGLSQQHTCIYMLILYTHIIYTV